MDSPAEARETTQHQQARTRGGTEQRAAEVWEAEALDVTRAALESFAGAAGDGPQFPIPVDQMIHGAGVTEAVIRSATSGQMEKVG